MSLANLDEALSIYPPLDTTYDASRGIIVRATVTTAERWAVPRQLKGCLSRWTASVVDVWLTFGNANALVVSSTAASTLTAASANSIKTSVATSASAVSYSGADLNGSIGAGAISPPRILTATAASHAHHLLCEVVFTAKDPDGAVFVDRIKMPNAGNFTGYGSRLASAVTTIDITAQGGTSGAWTFGTSAAVAGIANGAHLIPANTSQDFWIPEKATMVSHISASTSGYLRAYRVSP